MRRPDQPSRENSAEVTEGSPLPKVWSREPYDWSHPTTITWTAVESNFCTPGSHVSMDITPNGAGGSRVAVAWDRTAANLLGRINLAVIVLRHCRRPRTGFEVAPFRGAGRSRAAHHHLNAEPGVVDGGLGASVLDLIPHLADTANR